MELGQGEDEGGVDRGLEAYIRDRGGAITARDLAKDTRQYRPTSIAQEKLEGLVKAGRGVWVWERSDSGKGPSKRLFRLGSVDEKDPGGVENAELVGAGAVGASENETAKAKQR